MLDAVYNDLRNAYPKDLPLVLGEGKEDADIMLIGEAPGKDEVAALRPFCGKAGRNLDEFLQVIEIFRSDIFISNVCKFRPFKQSESGGVSNRTPTRQEISYALPFLYEEIAAVLPSCIVTLGNTPLRACMGDFGVMIGDFHGRAVRINIKQKEYSLFALYHPASIIYNPALKQSYLEDLTAFKHFIKNR